MNIAIRAATVDDYAAICETMSQPLAQANTLQLPWPSPDMWKKRLVDTPAENRILVALIDGKLVGHAGVQAAAKSPRCRHVAVIGMSVHDAYHRKGVGSALLVAILDLACNWLQYTRIELTVFVDNAAAIALYKKFGFEIEGTHKKYAFRNGQFADVYTMAKIQP